MDYTNTAWQKEMSLKMDFNNMMTEFVEKGIAKQEIDGMHNAIETARQRMHAKKEAGKLGFMEIIHNQQDIVEEINQYVNSVKDATDSFVVLGIGGSALGPMAVQQAINHPYYNELPRGKRKFPKLYIADNVDPERLVYLFDILDMEKTIFNVVSKSGSTSETMSQFMIIKEMLEQKVGKEKAQKQIVCTTDQENGNLIKIAKEENYKTFYIPQNVGGRFSELTPVGLLPAAMCGIDIEKLLAGARYMDLLVQESDIYKNPAFMYAVLHYIALEQGKNISVMMPYADSLKYMSDWYAQLWAESLGKKFDNENNIVHVGQTPVKALGVTDQHSQVQLYSEGPFDKIIVFLAVENYRETITIPKIYEDIKSLGFLGGHTHNTLIDVERMSTEYALYKAGKTNMTITLKEVNEFTVGQLLYFFEAATGFMGELLNIDPYDQPGVEEGKNATYAMFLRPGYEEKKKELDGRPKKKEDYII